MILLRMTSFKEIRKIPCIFRMHKILSRPEIMMQFYEKNIRRNKLSFN